jgi:hypothetical protein
MHRSQTRCSSGLLTRTRLKEPKLRVVDELLNDDAIVDGVPEVMRGAIRPERSSRYGTPPEVARGWTPEIAGDAAADAPNEADPAWTHGEVQDGTSGREHSSTTKR